MNGQGYLAKKKAYNLFKLFKEFCIPGSGIVRYKRKTIESNIQYIEIVMCKVQDILHHNALNLLQSKIKIAFVIEQTYLQSYAIFVFHYENILQQIIASNPQRLFSIVLDYSQQTALFLLKLIRFLQDKQLFVHLVVKSTFQTFRQYQNCLSKFSYDILQQQMLLLQGISLIVDLPKIYNMQKDETYSTILLTILKRTLPTSLGSLVIQDWISKELENTIFKMHFLKNIKPCWVFQFCTQIQSNGEKLGCECIGID